MAEFHINLCTSGAGMRQYCLENSVVVITAC